MVLLTQIILSVLLFFIINFIGAHSYSVGYMNMSVVYKEDKAPMLNLAIRMFSPVVFIIVISAIFAKIGLVSFNNQIWLVSLFYVVFRLFVVNVIIFNRFRLLNWYREIFCAICTIALSYYVYIDFIKDNSYIFPSLTDITNEIWMLIMLFLFQLLSIITNQSAKASRNRKRNYIARKYSMFKNQFGSLIDKKEKKLGLKILLYAIMVYEDFNRPPVIRMFENLISKMCRKKMTLGIMQVSSSRCISDEESICIAIKKINSALKKYKKKRNKSECCDYGARRSILIDYNPSDDYAYDVIEIYDQIKEMFYKHKDHRLVE